MISGCIMATLLLIQREEESQKSLYAQRKESLHQLIAQRDEMIQGSEGPLSPVENCCRFSCVCCFTFPLLTFHHHRLFVFLPIDKRANHSLTFICRTLPRCGKIKSNDKSQEFWKLD